MAILTSHSVEPVICGHDFLTFPTKPSPNQNSLMFQEVYHLFGEVHTHTEHNRSTLTVEVVVHVKTKSELAVAVSSGLNYLIPRYNESTTDSLHLPCSHLSKGAYVDSLIQVGSYKEVPLLFSSLQSFSMPILPTSLTFTFKYNLNCFAFKAMMQNYNLWRVAI